MRPDYAWHRAAVTIITAHIRVRDQGGFEIVRVARGQVQHRGKRMLDITGRTELATDHVEVGTPLAIHPLYHPRCREPERLGGGACQGCNVRFTVLQ